jgi:pyruvate kinase
LSERQNKIIETCIRIQRAIIIAGQVFQHLVDHAFPTRSEIVHFYNLLDYGANGIVLSDETAISKNPVNSLQQTINLLKI